MMSNKLSEFQKQRKEDRETIIAKAGELFLSNGFSNFSIKNLTDQLSLPKSNFYSHFKSKRELFYAFKNKEYNNFYERFRIFLDENKGEFKDVMINIANYFIHEGMTNFNRFQLIFATHAPPSHKIGPIEEKFISSPNVLIQTIVDIIIDAIKRRDIKYINPLFATYFLWDILYGNIRTIDRIHSGNLGDYMAYKKFTLNQLQNYLDTLYL